jgi:hypothetical protein
MDLTPYQTTTNRAHIVIKLLCDENGLPQDVVAAGNNISGLQTLDLSAGIVNNVILDGGSVDLSREGGSCLYSSDLPRVRNSVVSSLKHSIIHISLIVHSLFFCAQCGLFCNRSIRRQSYLCHDPECHLELISKIQSPTSRHLHLALEVA